MALIIKSKKVHNNDQETIDFGQPVFNAYVVMAGFFVDYQNSHQVKVLEGRIKNVSTGETAVDFEVEAYVKDNSGNTGGGDLWVTAIGQTSGDSTVFVPLDWKGNDDPVSYEIPNQVSMMATDKAGVFLQSFKLKYGGDTDHKVRTLKISSGLDELQAENVVDANGNYTWQLDFKPVLKMKDNSGNDQKNSECYADLLIMAVPEGQ